MVYWLWEVVVDSALIKKGVRKKCAGQPRIYHPEDDRWSAMDQRIMHAAAPSSPHKCREETGVEGNGLVGYCNCPIELDVFMFPGKETDKFLVDLDSAVWML